MTVQRIEIFHDESGDRTPQSVLTIEALKRNRPDLKTSERVVFSTPEACSEGEYQGDTVGCAHIAAAMIALEHLNVGISTRKKKRFFLSCYTCSKLIGPATRAGAHAVKY